MQNGGCPGLGGEGNGCYCLMGTTVLQFEKMNEKVLEKDGGNGCLFHNKLWKILKGWEYQTT